MREKNKDTYLELDRMIHEKENQVMTLHQKKRALQNQIDTYQDKINEIFFREESNHIQLDQGNEKKKNNKMKQAINEVSVRQKEQVERRYRIENNLMQNEIQKLEREKNNLLRDRGGK